MSCLTYGGRLSGVHYFFVKASYRYLYIDRQGTS